VEALSTKDLGKCLNTIESCSEYFAFAKGIKKLNLSPDAATLAEKFKDLCFRKF
jgi:hypothetical protein